MSYTAEEIKQSRVDALAQVRTFLEADDVEGQFAGRSGDHYSPERFIVVWKGNFRDTPIECSLSKTDSFYRSFSGFGSVYTKQGIFYQKQVKGYSCIWRGLLEVGLLLCNGMHEHKDFFNQYAPRYNRWVEMQKQPSENKNDQTSDIQANKAQGQEG